MSFSERFFCRLRQCHRMFVIFLPLPFVSFLASAMLFPPVAQVGVWASVALVLWAVGFSVLVTRYPSAVLENGLMAIIVAVIAAAVPILGPVIAAMNPTQAFHASVWPLATLFLLWMWGALWMMQNLFKGVKRSYRFQYARALPLPADEVFEALKLAPSSSGYCGLSGPVEADGWFRQECILFDTLSETYLGRPLFSAPITLGDEFLYHMRVIDEGDGFQIVATEFRDQDLPASVSTLRVSPTLTGCLVQQIEETRLTRLGALKHWLENFHRVYLDCAVDHMFFGVLRYSINQRNLVVDLANFMDSTPPQS